MQDSIKPCNFTSSTSVAISKPLLKSRLFIILRKKTPPLARRIFREIKLMFFSSPAEKYFAKATTAYSSSKTILNKKSAKHSKNVLLELHPGDLVEVRSMDEILTTFDKQRKTHGLGFMFGMEEYCGKRFMVFKIVHKIKLETTGEIRKVRYPSILLENLYCDGKHYDGCDRTCFYFWSEEWLKKVL